MEQTNKMLSLIGESFPQQTSGQTRRMKVSGMDFHIRSFHAKGLGHVSQMVATGFFGLMKMDTLIITPLEVDMPLFSYDRVLAMGNDTLIFELYDTLLGQTDLSGLETVKAGAGHLPEHDLGAHWYDSIKLPVSLSKKGKKLQPSLLIERLRTICVPTWKRQRVRQLARAVPSGKRHRCMWKAF